MREISISKNESGKRLDKFLSQYFSNTSMGFLYKMLRKKNITLNKKKADGKEILQNGDVISVFFSDETYDKFANKFVTDDEGSTEEYLRAFKKLRDIKVVYEDDDILLFNKPAEILSQKSDGGNLSINEYLIGYLLSENSLDQSTLKTFRPSVCNRLDRNTSGIVICSKSLDGARAMSSALKERSLEKYYRTYVWGRIDGDARIEGYLKKDNKINQVKLFDKEVQGASKIETSYRVAGTYSLMLKDKKYDVTELEVELITGKTHQIRAHLSSIGHPILGDSKYGYSVRNAILKDELDIRFQLLHAYRIVFPVDYTDIPTLSGREFKADLPERFEKLSQKLFS